MEIAGWREVDSDCPGARWRQVASWSCAAFRRRPDWSKVSEKGEIDNERVEMPLECRSLADLHEKRAKGSGGGKGRSQCGLLSSHGLHTFASPHLSLGHAAPTRTYPISTSCVIRYRLVYAARPLCYGIQDRGSLPSGSSNTVFGFFLVSVGGHHDL